MMTNHQRVVLDVSKRRVATLQEIQGLLDQANEALQGAVSLATTPSRPNTPEPLKRALAELLRLGQATSEACLQTTQVAQRDIAEQVIQAAS